MSTVSYVYIVLHTALQLVKTFYVDD